MATPEEPADRAPSPSVPGRALAAVRETMLSHPRAVIAIVAGGAVLMAGTTAAARLLHPDLAQMPPIMRRPAVAAAPPSPTPAPAPLVASAASPSPRPTAPRSRRPSPSRSPSLSPTPAVPLLALSFEAEAAQRSSQPRPRALATASGGVIMGYIGRFDEFLRFRKVTVPAAGTYTVTIFYTTDGGREADLRINGGPRIRVNFASTGSFNTIRARQVQVTLRAGENTIDLWNVNSTYAPDIDRLTVTR